MNSADRHETIKQFILRLQAGCDEKEFVTFKCPVCGEAMALNMHPNRRGFFLHCRASTIHVGVTQTIENPADWWDNYISGGWLD
jgi:hypothetical protein